MARRNRNALGSRYEQVAVRHLRQQGLRLLTRNFRTRSGEIDVVMRDAGCLVFVEVRYRGPGDYVTAAESVDEHKQRRLTMAARGFLRKNARLSVLPVRFDVVAIDEPVLGKPQLRWIRDAFRPGE